MSFPFTDLESDQEPSITLDDFPLSPIENDSTQVRARLLDADSLNNDLFNKASKMGPIGVPPEIIARTPGHFDTTELDRISEMIQQRPAMRKIVLDDPGFVYGAGSTESVWKSLIKVYDDFSFAAIRETASEFYDDTGRTFTSAGRELEAGSLLLPLTARGFPVVLNTLFQGEGRVPNAENDAKVQEIWDRLKELQQQSTIEDANLLQKTLLYSSNQIVFSGTAMVVRGFGTIVGKFVKFPHLGIVLSTGWVGAVEATSFFYGELERRPDIDKQELAAVSMLVGTINGALENLSLGALSKTMSRSFRQAASKLLADKRFRDLALTAFKRMAIQMGTNGFQEFTQEIPNLFGEAFNDWKEGILTAEGFLQHVVGAEAQSRMLHALEAGVLGAGGMSLAATLVGGISGKFAIDRAKLNVDVMQRMVDTSIENSSIIEKMPDRYKQLVDLAAEEGGTIEGFYINPEQLLEAYKDSPEDLQALFDAIPTLRVDINDASELLGKVRISPGDFATYVAGGAQFDKLKQNISFADDQGSLNEATQMGSSDFLETLFERMKAITGNDPSDPVTATEVELDLATSLEAIFLEDLPAVNNAVAKNSAQVFARMITGINRMDGQDPLDAAITLLERLRVEQRPELDSPAEQARTDTFGAEGGIFDDPKARAEFDARRAQDVLILKHENIVSAALRLADGRIFKGNNHGTAFIAADEAGVTDEDGEFEEGFIDDDGNFLTRDESLALFGKGESVALGAQQGLPPVKLGIDDPSRFFAGANRSLNRQVRVAEAARKLKEKEAELEVEEKGTAEQLELDIFKSTTDREGGESTEVQEQARLTEAAVEQRPDATGKFAEPGGVDDRDRRKGKRGNEGRKFRTGKGEVRNNRKTLTLEDESKITVGRQRPQDWVERVESVGLTAEQIKNFRSWYSEVTGLFAATFGNDAPLFTAAWLMAQQNASPTTAMTNMLRVREQLLNGLLGKKGSKKGGVAHDRLVSFWTEVLASSGFDQLTTLAGAQKLYDFVDSAMGKRTRTWMGDRKSGGEPAVIDVHTARDVGFVDETFRDRLISLGANKRAVNSLTIDMKGAPTEAQYERAAEYLHTVRDYLNENNLFGGNFERVAEVQALGWMALLVQTGQEAASPQEALDRRTFTISTEVVFGEGAPYNDKYGDIRDGLSMDDMIGLTHSTVYTALSKVSSMLGDPPFISVTSGTGAWVSAVNASTQLRFLASNEVSLDIATALGYLLQQTEVWSGRDLQMTPKGNWPSGATHWFVDVTTKGGELDIDANRTQLFALMLRQTGEKLGYSPIEGGIRLYIDRKGDDGKNLSWGIGNATKAQESLRRKIIDPIIKAGEAVAFDADVNWAPGHVQEARNDWSKNKNGEVYLKRFANRPAVQRELRAARGAVEETIETELERRRKQGRVVTPEEEERLETEAAIADQNRRFAAKRDARAKSIFKMRAYHGGGENFKGEFDSSKIGTGEGVQAVGYGLYFSTSLEIAEFYRESLTFGDPTITLDGKSVNESHPALIRGVSSSQILEELNITGAEAGIIKRMVIDKITVDAIIERQIREIADAGERNVESQFIQREQAILDAAESLRGRISIDVNEGQVFEVELPGPENLMDWDAPFSEQTKFVQAGFRAVLKSEEPLLEEELFKELVDNDETGADFYNAMVGAGVGNASAAREVSEALAEAGILGHKYAAGRFSGTDGSDETNFVIYDDKAIKIQKRFYQRVRAGGKNRTRGQLVIDRTLHRFLLQISEGEVNDATLIHELGHLALELVMDAAENPAASREIVEFRDKVWEHLGVTSREEIGTDHHEKWAESLELYLREGKAPAEDLRKTFAFFRRRMLKVYASIRNRLVNASHDMSMAPLFDQLLATEDQIASAAMEIPIISAFTPEQLATMPPRDAERIARALAAAQEEEREILERNIAREMDRVQRAQRSALRDDITEEVMDRPEQRLLFWLRRGVLPSGEEIDGIGHAKLSADAIDAITGGVEFRKTLPRGTFQREGGLAPDFVASAFGYSGAEELLDALAQTERPEKIIADRTQEEAVKQGLVATPEENRDAAWEALEGPKRNLLYEVERRVAKKLGAAEPALRAAEERDIEGETAPTAAETRARVTEAQAALDQGIDIQAPQEEIDKLQVALAGARAGETPAQVARRDQQAAARLARDAPAKIPTQVLTATARRVVEGVLVRDLPRKVAGWIGARQRASKAKVDASVKRDWEKVSELIDQEQLAHAQATEGGKAKADIKKWLRLFKSFESTKGRSKRARLLKHANVEDESSGKSTNYMDVIDGLLSLVSLGNISGKKLDTADLITNFVEKREFQQGIIIPLPPWVEELKAAPSFKNMTVGDMEDLYLAIRTLEKHGMDLVKVAEGDISDVDAIELADLQSQLDIKKPHFRKKFGQGVWAQQHLRSQAVLASLISLETVADYIDDLNPSGPFNRAVVHRIQRSAQAERTMKKEAAGKLNEAWETIYTARERRNFFHDRIFIRGLGEALTKNEMMSVAASMGNDHNRAALMESAEFPMNEELLTEILSHISDKDADFLEAVTEVLESFWPEASAMERRVNGIVPRKVDAVPWQLPSGRWMKGGYHPLDFNNNISARADELQERNDLQGLFPGVGSPMTKHGHLKQRLKTSGGLTIRADFMGTVSKHIRQVSKDTAWRETIIHLNRLFRKLEPNLTPVIGEQFYKTLRPYLQRLSNERADDILSDQWINRLAGNARTGLGLLAMGWRITSAAIQAAGFLPAMARVGTANVMKGYREIYFGNAMQNITDMRELVPDLRDRAETFDRDAQREVLRFNPVDVRHPIRSLSSVRSFTMHGAYYMLGMIDTFTATAVAKGAMIQSLNGELEHLGPDAPRAGDIGAAAEYAGKIVRSTQGSGEAQNRAAIFSGAKAIQLFTAMMTYSNTMLNQALLNGLLAYEETKGERASKRKAGVPTNQGRFWAFMMFTYVASPMLEEVIRHSLKALHPREPEDDEEKLKRILVSMAGDLVGGVPIARDFAGFFEGYGADTAISDQVKVWSDVLIQTGTLLSFDGEFDGEKITRAWANFGTYTMALPTRSAVTAYEVLVQEEFGRN